MSTNELVNFVYSLVKRQELSRNFGHDLISMRPGIFTKTMSRNFFRYAHLDPQLTDPSNYEGSSKYGFTMNFNRFEQSFSNANWRLTQQKFIWAALPILVISTYVFFKTALTNCLLTRSKKGDAISTSYTRRQCFPRRIEEFRSRRCC